MSLTIVYKFELFSSEEEKDVGLFWAMINLLYLKLGCTSPFSHRIFWFYNIYCSRLSHVRWREGILDSSIKIHGYFSRWHPLAIKTKCVSFDEGRGPRIHKSEAFINFGDKFVHKRLLTNEVLKCKSNYFLDSLKDFISTGMNWFSRPFDQCKTGDNVGWGEKWALLYWLDLCVTQRANE